MRRFWCLACGGAWVACQPIVVGIPASEDGGSSSSAGSSAVPSAGVGGSSDSGGGDRGGEPALTPSDAGGSGEAEVTAPSAAGQAGAAGDPCSLRISGHLSSLRGHAIVGAPLVLSGDADATTQSDANGNYAFTGLCPGQYQVMPTCLTSAVQLKL